MQGWRPHHGLRLLQQCGPSENETDPGRRRQITSYKPNRAVGSLEQANVTLSRSRVATDLARTLRPRGEGVRGSVSHGQTTVRSRGVAQGGANPPAPRPVTEPSRLGQSTEPRHPYG